MGSRNTTGAKPSQRKTGGRLPEETAARQLHLPQKKALRAYISPSPSGLVLGRHPRARQRPHHGRSIPRLRKTNQPIHHRVQPVATAGSAIIVAIASPERLYTLSTVFGQQTLPGFGKRYPTFSLQPVPGAPHERQETLILAQLPGLKILLIYRNEGENRFVILRYENGTFFSHVKKHIK